MPYPQYLQTAHWRARRNQALKRIGYHCSRCQVTRNLEVHHRTYERLGAELDTDLEVLCRGCHLGHHVNEIENNLAVYFKVVSDVLRTEGPFEMLADLIEAVKVRCARAKIPYSDGQVHTAIARMKDQRLSIEAMPLVPRKQAALLDRAEGGPLTRAEAAGWMAKLGGIAKSMPDVAMRLNRREHDSVIAVRKLEAAMRDSNRRCHELEQIAAAATLADVGPV